LLNLLNHFLFSHHSIAGMSGAIVRWILTIKTVVEVNGDY